MTVNTFNELLSTHLAYIDRQAERDSDELRMFRAILELAQQAGTPDGVYDRLLVAERMRGLGWKDRSGKLSESLKTGKLDQTLSEDIKRIWDRLLKALEEGGRSRGLAEAARSGQYAMLLLPEEVLFDTKNNVVAHAPRGPLTRRAYRLVEKPIRPAEQGSPKPAPIRPIDVSYQLDLSRKPMWLARPLIRGFGLQTLGRRLAFVLAFASPFVGLFFLISWVLFKTHSALTPATLGVYLTLVGAGSIWWTLFGPFLQVVDSRGEEAPFWMGLWSSTPVLLRWGKVPPNEYPILEVVRYSASCPICAGDIVVSKSTIEFRSRLVGRCRQSPREHVFSFDHVTLTGRFLR